MQRVHEQINPAHAQTSLDARRPVLTAKPPRSQTPQPNCTTASKIQPPPQGTGTQPRDTVPTPQPTTTELPHDIHPWGGLTNVSYPVVPRPLLVDAAARNANLSSAARSAALNGHG